MIFLESEAGSQQADSLPKKVRPKYEQLPDDANKEKCASKTVSVQIEVSITPHKKQPNYSQQTMETALGDKCELINLVLFHVAITVSLGEGDTHVLVNGSLQEARILNTGDVVSISDVQESTNWTISKAPTAKHDRLIVYHLETDYDHYRIIA